MRYGLLVTAFCFGAGACASPYSSPRIDDGITANASRHFDGIADVVEAGDTRLVWVHGMCSHDADWAKRRYATLARAIGAVPTDPVASPPRGADEPETVRFETTVGNSNLTTSYPIWSPLSARFKEDLIFDRMESAGGEFPYERASLNAQLKSGLMNDCLVDAVVYSGENGDSIRHFMQTEVCKALDGEIVGNGCDIPPDSPSARTIFVAESLGSKLLFDAIRSIWNGSPRSVQAQLAEQLASVQLVFLLANQVPILDAADQTPSAGADVSADFAAGAESSVEDFVGILSAAKRRSSALLDERALDPVQLVAFTDPNDLLSYRLKPDLLNLGDVSVANIIVSNDPTYFGFVERPDLAHCGYQWNPFVIGAIVHGYSGAAFPTVALDLPKQCGLADAPKPESGGS